MGFGDPDWDVATVTRDMLRDPLDTGTSDFGDATGIDTIPDDRVVLANTEAGKSVTYTEEYLIVSEVQQRDKTWRYLDMSGYDANAAAFVEAATPISRARREEIWGEIDQIVEDHRKMYASPGTPGEWDTLVFDGAPVNDEAFQWWALEVTFLYDATARKVQ